MRKEKTIQTFIINLDYLSYQKVAFMEEIIKTLNDLMWY